MFPCSFGAYIVPLSFGISQQPPSPFIKDTGTNYTSDSYAPPNTSAPRLCLPKHRPPKTPTFNPVPSTSSKPVYCYSRNCKWIHGKRPKCGYTAPCPGYDFMFAAWTTQGISLGSTFGSLMTETMESAVADVLIGWLEFLQPPTRRARRVRQRPQSLPSQMGSKKFSFCLLAHYYDDSFTYGNIVLDDETEYSDLSYTPFIESSVENSHITGYHYLRLEEIIVGDKPIKLPEEKLLRGREGNGGTIADTGIPFTFLERSIFQHLSEEFESQMADITRAPDQGVLGPCFSSADINIQSLPRLSFLCSMGVRKWSSLCRTISRWTVRLVCCACRSRRTPLAVRGPNVGLSGGPFVNLGYYLLMDFFLEFNLQNSTFAFLREYCDWGLYLEFRNYCSISFSWKPCV